MKLNINGKELEIDNEVISKGLEEGAEAVSINSDFVIRTPDEESGFVENIKSSSNAANFEIGRKKVLQGLGIEVDGQHKSDEAAINAVKAFVSSSTTKALEDANIKPAEKVKELTNDLETLRGNISTLQGEKESVLNEFTQYKQNQTRQSTLEKLIPDNVVNRQDAMDLMSVRLKTSFDDNGNLVGIGKDGNPMKDQNLNPLPIDQVVGNWFNDNSHLLKSAEGGAGGGDSSSGSGKMTFAEFEKQQNEAGNSTNGEAFVKNMTEAIKAGKLESF